MNNFLCHWEIPSENPAELRSFYSTLFNWKINAGDCMGREYNVCDVGEEGVWGAIDKVDSPNAGVIIYIMVEDIDTTENKIVELGGEIIKSKLPIKGTGIYSQFKDPQGNYLGIFQPLKQE